MKLRLFFFLFFAQVLSMTTFADAAIIDGIYYTLFSDGTASVSPLNHFINSSSTSVVIPATVTYNGKDYNVTSIGGQAFYCCQDLTSVTIPNSVSSIGLEAFQYCGSLTSITIPEGVTTIENRAFQGCSNLDNFNIPNSLTSFGCDVFEGTAWEEKQVERGGMCYIGSLLYGWMGPPPTKRRTITIKSGTKIIAGDAFRDFWLSEGNVWMTSVSIPNSVTYIGEGAFAFCRSLKSVHIPNSVTYIGDDAFKHCDSLRSINIPSSVTYLGQWAFTGCENLTSISIPSSVTCIRLGIFEECTSLKSVTIGDGITTIELGAFQSCESLASVNIPEGVTSIEQVAFLNCISLTSINLPESLTSIGSSAFENTGLISIDIPKNIKSLDDGAFSNCKDLTHVNIPSTLSIIDGFNNCTSLESIFIPMGVTEIAVGAFAGCSALSSISIPPSLTRIGGGAFDGTAWYNSQKPGVTYLGEIAYKYKGDMPPQTSLFIRSGTRIIADDAFYDCSGLTSITIPKSVTIIGDNIFNGCSGLTDVYCYATQVPTCTDYSFVDVLFSTATLHVPASAIEDYRNTAHWEYFRYIVPLTDEEVGIEQIDNGQLAMDNEPGTWYTLDGKKLNGKPAAKGIFIRNGRKLMVE